jgi:hypothetical protein
MATFSDQAFDTNAFSLFAFSLGVPVISETSEILASVNFHDVAYKSVSFKTENCNKGLLQGDISRSVCFSGN